MAIVEKSIVKSPIVEYENHPIVSRRRDVGFLLGFVVVRVGVLEISTPTQNQYATVIMQTTKFIDEADIFRLVMHSKLSDEGEDGEPQFCLADISKTLGLSVRGVKQRLKKGSFQITSFKRLEVSNL